MAFPNANARQQYLKTQVETATKEQLVVMLFDGIIRFTEQARKAIENKQIEDSHNALMRAQAIVMELICTVDKEKGGEVASNLLALHAYAFNCLIKCNMYKDLKMIDEVQKIYRELREGWVGAMDSLGIGASKGGAKAAPAAPAKAPAAPVARTIGAPPPKTPGPAKPLPIAGKVLPPKPGVPASNVPVAGPGGTLAKAKVPAAAPAPKPAEPVKPAVPVTGYGMGRSAMMGGFPKAVPAASAARPVPAPAPAAIPAASPVVAKPISPMNAKQAAMLNAYQAGSRSIA